MASICKLDVPEECRTLSGQRNFTQRLRVAREFIKLFVDRIAPPKSLGDSDKAWTQAVRRRFIEICPQGCYAHPSNPLTRRGEYLADYTWLGEAGGRVLLAGESEWGTVRFNRTSWARVEQDFEKLLVIKAPFKVLVFSSVCGAKASQNESDINFTFDYAQKKLKAYLENYWDHLTGEVYIFVDFPQTRVKGGNGRYQYAIWQAREYGMQGVVFDDIGGDRLSR